MIDTESAREEFDVNGVVCLRGVLQREDVDQVRSCIDHLFSEYGNQPQHMKYISEGNKAGQGKIAEINHCLRLSKKLKQSDLVSAVRTFARKLSGTRALTSFDHAIYKTAGSGHVAWHQDQAYKASVKRMRSVIAWIPLHDMTRDMGCMGYVPLTKVSRLQHHLSDDRTGALYTYKPADEDIVHFEANMGDVIFHSPLTMHSSYPNLSSMVRKAWIVHFCPYGRLEPFLPGNLFHLSRYLFASGR